MTFLDRLRPVALLLARMALGVIFIYHGYPKLFGDTTQALQFFVQVGLPSYFVYVAGIVELFGGALLIAGLFTRIAGVLLAGQMAVAIWKVHLGKGILAVSEYQFPLALAALCVVLATVGPGVVSIDHAIFRKKS